MLYYDFSTGLEVAKPSSNSSSLTISSTTNKAVRRNKPPARLSWRALHLERRGDTWTLVYFFGGVELQEVLWLKL